MRFENVAKLVSGIDDVLQEMRYSWVDAHGLICHQESTFRVNCMDCLDRTNVVQVIHSFTHSFIHSFIHSFHNKLALDRMVKLIGSVDYSGIDCAGEICFRATVE